MALCAFMKNSHTKKPPVSQESTAHLLVIILSVPFGTTQVGKINGNKNNCE